MADYKIISADTHIVEPPDLWEDRIDHRFRHRAPELKITKNEDGILHHAWFVEGNLSAPLGATVQNGVRFDDPTKIDWMTRWPEIDRSTYEPNLYVDALAEDGIWGAVLLPSVGLGWWRIADSALLSAVGETYNDWIAEFVSAQPERLKGLAIINVDNVIEACEELERCKKLGLAGALIPVHPGDDRPYRDPIHERFWWTAQDLEMPLCLHVGTNRVRVPADGLTSNQVELPPSMRATFDYWVRLSLSDIVFAGVFDRYPELKMGSVEHEMAWVPFWLDNMDFTYRERDVFTKGWRSKSGLIPSDFWRRNMFTTFTEDKTGVEFRDKIGMDNMMWGSDFPHAESVWPKSMEFLDRMFADASEDERKRATAVNAARIFGFDLEQVAPSNGSQPDAAAQEALRQPGSKAKLAPA